MQTQPFLSVCLISRINVCQLSDMRIPAEVYGLCQTAIEIKQVFDLAKQSVVEFTESVLVIIKR